MYRKIVSAIRRALAPPTIYVVCRAEGDALVTDIEVFVNPDQALRRQRELGGDNICYAECSLDPRGDRQ